MTDKTAIQLLKRHGSLKRHRSTWESHWQEVADYVVPRKADITKKRSAGDKRTELLFDGTAIHAAELLSASLHGMLTNMSVKWFSLSFTDTELNGNDEAKEWLESVETVMYQAFARSNFAEQVHELYHDLITFGTGVMFVDSDPDQNLRFSTRHIGECYLSEDEHGRVDTIYREFKMPVRAAIKRFKDGKISIKMLKKAEDDPYQEITLVHAVFKRDERDPTKLNSENKPFASVYIDPDQKEILSESGFDENPYLCPRFLKASFENSYGRSPAMSALADIKMLSKMSEVIIRAAQKQIDPPLMVPDDGFMSHVRTVPGGINYYRSGTRDRIEPLNIQANNVIGLNMEEQRRNAIRSAFYVDQLILSQGPQMTATEVIQRTEEKMRLLGPVLGRLQAELLQPLINRVFNLLERQNLFAIAPEFIQSGNIDIEYVSPLAKAQRQGDLQSVMRMFELFTPVSEIDPSILDYVDMDGVAKHLMQTLSIPATVVKSNEQVEEIREQRAQAEAVAAENAAITQTAEAGGAVAPLAKVVNG